MATTAGKNKQVEDAKAAKKAEAKKDVAEADPNFMPNIEPQVGKKAEADAPKGSVVEKFAKTPSAKKQTKTERLAAAKAAAKNKKGGVRIDPNLPLVLGNTVTFVADEGEGRVMAKLETPQGVQWVAATSDHGDSRFSWIVQVKGDLKVEFHDDGKKYASGEFSVN